MKANFIATLAVVAVLASAAFAQTAENARPSDNAIAWDNAATPVKHKTLQFSRIVSQIPQSEPVGRYYYGLTCALNSTPIYTKHSGDMSVGDFRKAFEEQLAATGYTSGGDSLFGDIGGTEPNLLVAAAVTELKINSCMPNPQGGLFGGRTANATTEITVEWQVLDALERKIVFKGTSHGTAKAKSDPETIVMVSMRAAFSEATRALLATAEFQQVTSVTASEQATTESLSQTPVSVTPLPGLPLSTQTFQQRLKDIQAQVVVVRTGTGSGSGYYIADGLLLTNHHVAAKGTPVKVRFLSGKEVPGLTIASNSRRDVALIRTENVDLTGLPLRLQVPEVGSTVFVMGTPMLQELEGTVTSGIVSASARLFDHQNWIQSDVAVTHGNSGGPMFDDKGNVIGMTDRGIASRGELVPNVNLFIPIAEALQSVGVVIQPPGSAKATKVSAKKKAP
jgi:S1-C subfamily serine protease